MQFPPHIKVTPCATYTRTVLIHTRHGVMRREARITLPKEWMQYASHGQTAPR